MEKVFNYLALSYTPNSIGSDLKKGELERIFHFLITEDIVKEIYAQNSSGFSSGYVVVSNLFDI